MTYGDEERAGESCMVVCVCAVWTGSHEIPFVFQGRTRSVVSFCRFQVQNQSNCSLFFLLLWLTPPFDGHPHLCVRVWCGVAKLVEASNRQFTYT